MPKGTCGNESPTPTNIRGCVHEPIAKTKIKNSIKGSNISLWVLS